MKLSERCEALQALKNALGDELVHVVLRHREIVKTSLHERLENALNSVPPMLAAHGGHNRWQPLTRDCLCWSYGLSIAGHIAVIADSGNNRVLLWEPER